MVLGDGIYMTILPLRTAIDMGATRILAVSVSPDSFGNLHKAPRSPFPLISHWIELLCGQDERNQVEYARMQLDGHSPVRLSQSRVKLVLPQGIDVPAPANFNPKEARKLYTSGRRVAADAFDKYESPWDAPCYSFAD